MAIIKPSLKFEGSELNLTVSAAPYIQESVRRAVFNKTNNQEGAYLYFLPAYKADSSGNGIWYKKIAVRDNFGTNFKEKYYVASRSNDPAEYFANNFKILYPEEAKVTDTEVNGRKFKKYPNFGRVTERVVYNVAFAQSLSTGAHVLDLPLRNGADNLMNWLEGRDMTGNRRNPINDPDRCVPVFVKLKENSANPWMIQIENNSPVQLPEQLADSDYLYNLDEIFINKPKEEIIAKLREMYSADVFEDCMNGYPGLTKSNTASFNVTAKQVTQPAVELPPARPQMEIAKAVISSAPVAVPAIEIPRAALTAPAVAVNVPLVANISDVPAAVDISSLPPNPMAGKISRADALKFINQD
jgi:hypothetical protein